MELITVTRLVLYKSIQLDQYYVYHNKMHLAQFAVSSVLPCCELKEYFYMKQTKGYQVVETDPCIFIREVGKDRFFFQHIEIVLQLLENTLLNYAFVIRISFYHTFFIPSS